jgi:drug/metabolite transporter (DMT)-like permease
LAPGLVIGALSLLAYILVLYAYRLAPVSVVAPARLSIVIGSLLGWLWQGVTRADGSRERSSWCWLGIVALAAR